MNSPATKIDTNVHPQKRRILRYLGTFLQLHLLSYDSGNLKLLYAENGMPKKRLDVALIMPYPSLPYRTQIS